LLALAAAQERSGSLRQEKQNKNNLCSCALSQKQERSLTQEKIRIKKKLRIKNSNKQTSLVIFITLATLVYFSLGLGIKPLLPPLLVSYYF
jgi:hypothetical protein